MDARAIIDDPRHAESLRVAENRTLEMIADGSSLEDTLNELCRAIDAQSSSVYSTILLMDPQAKHLWHAAGRDQPAAIPGSAAEVGSGVATDHGRDHAVHRGDQRGRPDGVRESGPR